MGDAAFGTIQNGSQFTKSEYQIQKTDESFIFPESSQVKFHNSLVSQKAAVLIFGYSKQYKTDLCAKDIQNIIYKYYCIETIEVYMEKTFHCIGSRSRCLPEAGPNGIHLYHNKLGISYTKKQSGNKNEVMFGSYGEYKQHNNEVGVRAIFVIPKLAKYAKAKQSTHPYSYTYDEKTDEFPVLDGPQSIAQRSGPEQQREYKSFIQNEAQRRLNYQNILNTMRQTMQANNIPVSQEYQDFLENYVENSMKHDELMWQDHSHWIPLKDQPDYMHFVANEFDEESTQKKK